MTMPDASVTFTLHLWWLWPYLAAGAVLWLPLEWVAWRRTTKRRHPFWTWLRVMVRDHWYEPVVIVLVWPAAVWEEIR